MSLGATVRRLLGPLDATVARYYRGWFVDLDELADAVAALGTPGRVIEVGCGEGALTARMATRLGDAEFLGIDIAADPGRNAGEVDERVRFEVVRAEEVVERGERFDMVVLSDVVHHIPVGDRAQFLEVCRQLTAPGAVIAVKDWDGGRDIPTLFAYLSDRFISGDRNVKFLGRAAFIELLRQAWPDGRVLVERRIGPRRNNVLVAVGLPA
jgi:2-polyprenyl-6-hydroxyphenyl methylase/3-demethylubiquinone-9 3-methyltransferase